MREAHSEWCRASDCHFDVARAYMNGKASLSELVTAAAAMAKATMPILRSQAQRELRSGSDARRYVGGRILGRVNRLQLWCSMVNAPAGGES